MQRVRIVLSAFALLVSLGAGFSQSAVVLISDDEAKLPPPKPIAVDTRGVTRGPKIVIEAPEGAFRSPTPLKVTFQSFGGVTIDPDSVRVVYLRTPDVDITARIRPFAGAAGIDLPAAVIPFGEHQLRVDIKDTRGREASKVIVLKAER